MDIELKILNTEFYKGTALPKYSTEGSAGIDLVATKDYIILPQERVKIETGIAIHIGSERRGKTLVVGKELVESLSVMGVIVPRSGLGTKGLVLANTIGIIDSDYQGEIIISAWNSNPHDWAMIESPDDLDYGKIINLNNKESFIDIKAGMKIAQLILLPVIKATWDIVEEFSSTTQRQGGGFGSTGA